MNDRRVSKNKKTSKRKFLPLSILILAIGAGLVAYAIYSHYTNTSLHTKDTNNKSYSSPAPADNTPNNNRKTSSSPSSTLTNEGQQSSTSAGSFSVSIVSANVNNDNLHVGTLVSGITSGTCTLSASQTGQSTLQLATSNVKQDVNSYDCGVYNISTTQFSSSGEWTITLSVTSGGTQESSNTNVTIPSGG